jgi:hypothetical protein
MALTGNAVPVAGSPQRSDRSEVVSIPESSSQFGSYELLVVVSEIGRESVKPAPLHQISLDDVSPHLR